MISPTAVSNSVGEPNHVGFALLGATALGFNLLRLQSFDLPIALVLNTPTAWAIWPISILCVRWPILPPTYRPWRARPFRFVMRWMGRVTTTATPKAPPSSESSRVMLPPTISWKALRWQMRPQTQRHAARQQRPLFGIHFLDHGRAGHPSAFLPAPDASSSRALDWSCGILPSTRFRVARHWSSSRWRTPLTRSRRFFLWTALSEVEATNLVRRRLSNCFCPKLIRGEKAEIARDKGSRARRFSPN